MGKARGVARRRRKAGSFHYKRSNKLKRQRLRELRKCGPIVCDVVRESWNPKKSLINNMKNMGLSEDPNKLLSGPKLHEKFKKPSPNTESIVQRLHNKLLKNHEKTMKKKMKKSNEFNVEMETDVSDEKSIQEPKTVADKLAELASKPPAKNFRFGPEQIKFCSYMLQKYNDDYEAMCRDKRNYYQESAGQIRAKIRKFLSIKSHRNVYEMAQEMCDSELNSIID